MHMMDVNLHIKPGITLEKAGRGHSPCLRFHCRQLICMLLVTLSSVLTPSIKHGGARLAVRHLLGTAHGKRAMRSKHKHHA